jgi:Zn-dependent metalloprotease
MEQELKRQTNNANATNYPKGELFLAPYKGNFTDASYRLTYRFDVYAVTPLMRQYVFVDANTGEVIYTIDRIKYATNSSGTAVTAYSGNHGIVTDSTGTSNFRLRESDRGLGIETYNLQQSTTYTNTDFTDADNFWNNVNAAQDQYATDAHWGSEMTYDFYWTTFNRNSIDDAGMVMYSYVHYDVNFVNAFWDGTEMTYGDGDGTYMPLTSLDVTGHEISHGVTERTSGLGSSPESGAMNEGWSDCMGNTIRQYGKQAVTMDWLIGDELGGGAFRDMAYPNNTGNPDTYLGVNWDPNQEVHNNSTILSHWYYLLTMGGSGTNDNGDAYSVTGIGLDEAAAICYRMNTVYLFPTCVYADARTYGIQAAQDLFGGCSPEVIAATNAWRAVGIGLPFNATVTSSFTAATTSFCTIPATANFTNTSANGNTYLWHFGDGDTSSAANPAHTYLAAGIYTVTLDVDGGPCGNATNSVNNYIDITLPASPAASSASVCSGASASLNATGSAQLTWYDVPTGGTALGTGSVYNTPALTSPTTYYVESRIAAAPQHAGPANNSFGGGSNFTNTNYHDLIFDVYSPTTLVSVVVYAGAAGNRTFTLIHNAATLQTITVNVPNGQSTVTLNWPLPVGTAFELGCQGNVNLYRNNANASFPYTLNGVLSITGTNAGNPGYYYYFYDWILQGAPCVSARTPVPVTVNTITAGYNSSVVGGTASFTDISVSTGTIVSWHWDFGNGDTSNVQNPVYIYTTVNSYSVCLTITDNNGCTNTTCRQVAVIELGVNQLSLSAGISVFPNPVNNIMQISFGSATSSSWKMKLNNVIGQQVAEKIVKEVQAGNHIEWNLSSLAPGSYTLIMENDKGERLMKKIIRE